MNFITCIFNVLQNMFTPQLPNIVGANNCANTTVFGHEICLCVIEIYFFQTCCEFYMYTFPGLPIIKTKISV